jgi:hypothetical protein
MQYHTPQTIKRVQVPQFAVKNGELICPEKIFTKEEYPHLKQDLVKITGQNGQKIYVPRNKVSPMDV